MAQSRPELAPQLQWTCSGCVLVCLRSDPQPIYPVLLTSLCTVSIERYPVPQDTVGKSKFENSRTLSNYSSFKQHQCDRIFNDIPSETSAVVDLPCCNSTHHYTGHISIGEISTVRCGGVFKHTKPPYSIFHKNICDVDTWSQRPRRVPRWQMPSQKIVCVIERNKVQRRCDFLFFSIVLLSI